MARALTHHYPDNSLPFPPLPRVAAHRRSQLQHRLSQRKEQSEAGVARGGSDTGRGGGSDQSDDNDNSRDRDREPLMGARDSASPGRTGGEGGDDGGKRKLEEGR